MIYPAINLCGGACVPGTALGSELTRWEALVLPPEDPLLLMGRHCVNKQLAKVLFSIEVRNTSQVLALSCVFVVNLLPSFFWWWWGVFCLLIQPRSLTIFSVLKMLY